jgi:hypothetical protein
MSTIVIVPYRADGGHRDRLWQHLRRHYWSRLPYRIAMGEHTVGPFNRSAAINRAAAGRWDFAVIADSDTWVPAHQLAAAIGAASQTGRLTAAFSSVVEIDAPCTEALLDGAATTRSFGIDRIRTNDLETQSSMLAVPRPLWDAIGGFDEKFVGWGGEDNAYWRAATILGGRPNRIDGYAYHLWHPTADKRGPGYQANLRRWRSYRQATTPMQLRRIQRCSP